jgi:hypothetical protein
MVKDVEELPNSHGSAPVVWDALAQRYLGCGEFGYIHLPNDDILWQLYKHLGVPTAHRAVLVMTFDHAWVSKANYERAAGDVRAFLADFPQRPDRVNHWPRIAEIFESKPTWPGVAIWHTSVGDDTWRKKDCWAKAYEVYEVLESVAGEEKPCRRN